MTRWLRPRYRHCTSRAVANVQHVQFFAQLANLFEYNRTKGHGTVYFTQKRLTYGNVDESRTVYDNLEQPSQTSRSEDPLWDLHPEHPVPILVRASNNKSTKRPGKDKPGCERKNVDKIKLSTIVQDRKSTRLNSSHWE